MLIAHGVANNFEGEGGLEAHSSYGTVHLIRKKREARSKKTRGRVRWWPQLSQGQSSCECWQCASWACIIYCSHIAIMITTKRRLQKTLIEFQLELKSKITLIDHCTVDFDLQFLVCKINERYDLWSICHDRQIKKYLQITWLQMNSYFFVRYFLPFFYFILESNLAGRWLVFKPYSCGCNPLACRQTMVPKIICMETTQCFWRFISCQSRFYVFFITCWVLEKFLLSIMNPNVSVVALSNTSKLIKLD